MNKGFKALPEYVQKKIDPEMARQYYGGGSVMERPLFRQMGGPAAPPMMGGPAAPPMMGMPSGVSPQEVQQVNAMENVAMQQGEQMGQQLASDMMNNIDAAEDPKTMIDAIRGNQKPLESRYAELANLVGEADANKTPESVLALVQPTIMMTEEGAIDSGVGELMQNLVKDVDMSAGTPMTQGVGELMAMGAGNTPPANFNQGGPVMVRKFQAGSPPGGNKDQPLETTPLVASDFAVPDMKDSYAANRALFSSILGSEADRSAQLADQKKLAQAQFFFDLANFGAQLGGTTQGSTLAERISNAATQSQVFDRLGARGKQFFDAKSALDTERKNLDIAALQATQTQQAAAINARNTKLLQDDSQAFEIGKQAKLFTHQIDLQDDTQSHANSMFTKQAGLEKSLTRLRGLEGRKTAQLQAEIQEQLLFVKADIDLIDDLEKMGQKHLYDIEKIEISTEKSKELADFQSNLNFIEANSQRVFTAKQNALKIASAEKIQLESQAFDKVLRLELQQNGFDQDQINREVLKVQNSIANAFKEDAALRADETLLIQRLNARNDASYKANLLVIEDYKAQTARLKEQNKEPSTLVERQQVALNNSTSVSAFSDGSLDGEKLNTFVTTLQSYIKPSTDITGATSQNPIPSAVAAALREREKKGLDTFGIDSSLFSSTPAAGTDLEKNLEITQTLIDPNVNLEKGSGALSGLLGVFNWIGEQTVGELTSGTGTIFKGTKEAQTALRGLSSATRKFILEGRQLATELELSLEELPNAAFLTSDATTLANVEIQQKQLEGFVNRVEVLLQTPKALVGKDVSKIRLQQSFAKQLLQSYDAAYNIFSGANKNLDLGVYRKLPPEEN